MPIIPSRFYGRRPWAARANRHRPAPGALDELTWYTDGDGDADVSPAADERCDGIDDDCDGTADEPDATDAATWYADTDGFGRRRARHAFSAPTRCASDARIRSSSPGLR